MEWVNTDKEFDDVEDWLATMAAKDHDLPPDAEIKPPTGE